MIATFTLNSFKLTTTSTDTRRTVTAYFTVPNHIGINSASLSYVTLDTYGGNTQDAALYLDSTVRAHDNSWLGPGGKALLTSIFTPGQHSYRFHLKSTTSVSNTWELGTIVLTLDYTPPVSNPGTISLNKSSMQAGETVGISLSAADPGVTRTIQAKWGSTVLATIVSGKDSGAASYAYTFPLADCSRMPNSESGTLSIVMTGSVGDPVTKTVTINVPADVLPSLTDVSADIIANGLTVTGYVQGYSGVNIAINGAAGALGSTIAAYKITGGGLNVSAGTAQIALLMSAGDITFTGEIMDSRGRKASGTVTISVMPYTAPVFVSPDAYRSDDLGAKNQKGTYARLFSGVSYSSLYNQNSVTLKGRVYPKGGTVPAYTSMTPDTAWITGGGTLLVTKTYIAQMEVSDLIGSRVIEFTIPTKKTGISIMAGMLGAAIGKAAETPGILDVLWPIYSEDSRVLTEADCPYAVGDILQTLNTSSPEDRWPGTTWDDIAGRVLVGLDSTQTEFDTAGEEGGEKVHVLTSSEMPKHFHSVDLFASGGPSNPNLATGVANGYYVNSQNTSETGGDQAHNNLQPYKVVYM
ncbi:MAG: hypothetical protein EOM58_06625, partial [Clostridia bacterium]|nr:hypothetical protein [Clostridia bacterium]